MTTPTRSAVTQLLAAAGRGDPGARDRFSSSIYDELRRLAESQMAREAPGHVLQPTALVHEAYLRLFGKSSVQWTNRGHFFTAAAEAMRRIRIEDARKRGCLKRGGGRAAGPLTEDPRGFDQDPVEVLGVAEAVEELARLAPRQAQVVKLRYFSGLTVDECAAVLEVSPPPLTSDQRRRS